MELTAPCYYKEFQCTADRCRDNCCRTGWEIEIDRRTMDYYQSLPEPQRTRILAGIHQDEDGYCTIQPEGGQCPFLDEKGLCSLVLELGDEHIGDICALHPRYREWFPGRMEIGVGLCCEEAARLILSDSAPAEFETYLTDEDEEEEEDAPLYLPLLDLRDGLFEILQDRELSLKKRLGSALRLAAGIQEAINEEKLTGGVRPSNMEAESSDWQEVLSALVTVHQEMEHLEEDWQQKLNDLEEHLEELDWEGFEEALGERKYEYEHIAVYLIFRYFLKAVFDENALVKVQQAVAMILMMAALGARYWQKRGRLTLEDQIEVVRQYSKEVEYSDDNMETLAEAFLFEEELKTKRLLGLLEG